MGEELYRNIQSTRTNKRRNRETKSTGKREIICRTIKSIRNYFEKSIECYKVYAAFYFWYEYRIYKNRDIESAASKPLKEIVRVGIENEMQTLPSQTIEKILYHAAAENKINVDKIRDSKVIQAQLELIRREQE